MDTMLMCMDAVPQYFGIFDISVAPRLLFYAYIPAITIALVVAGYVVIKDKFSLESRLLGLVALSFAGWSLNTIIQWTAAQAGIVMFAWELTALFDVLIFAFSVYFTYVFIDKKDAPFRAQALLAVAIAPVLILLPTAFNAPYFDIGYCEGSSGILWPYVYAVQFIAMAWIVGIAAHRYHHATSVEQIGKIRSVSIGIVLFLSIFWISNVLGEITQYYEINLLGPVGMVVFTAFLSYMIVQFKAFNAKLLGANALVWGLCILIASQWLFVTEAVNFILVGATLCIAIIFGVVLIKSVKREVEQRERLQALSDQLQASNSQLIEVGHFKTQLLSIASHQIKAPLAALKGYITLILEKGYGEVPGGLEKPLHAMRNSANGLVDLITSLLDLRKIEEGKMDYQFARVDLAKMISQVIEELQLLASEKKLALNAEGVQQSVWVRADETKLKQVIQNLVDNAIKYTPHGFVTVTLSTKGRYATCVVSDSGLGLAPTLIPRLFDEFTRDQRVVRTIRGTGLGLYIAKRIIEAHGGSVTASSAGEGEGSQFTVSLPLDQTAA